MYRQGVCRVKPFGKKGEKFLPEASVVGRDIHSYHFNFPVGVGDAFYQNGLFVSIGAEFCHCFSQFSKSGSCSSGWNQRQSPFDVKRIVYIVGKQQAGT